MKRILLCGLGIAIVLAVVIAIFAGSDSAKNAGPGVEVPEGGLVVHHDEWTIRLLPGASGRLLATDGRADQGAQAASRELRDSVPGATLSPALRLELLSGRLGDDGAQLMRRLPRPVPRGRTAAFVFYDAEGMAWRPVHTSISADRRTLTARVDHLSLWSTVQYHANGILDKRVHAPHCDRPLPYWLDSTEFLDDSEAPVRWCAGGVNGDDDKLEVRLAVNRSYGVAVRTSVAPSAVRRDLFGEGPAEVTAHLIAGALEDSLRLFATKYKDALPVVGGEQVEFVFTQTALRDLGDKPLVEVSLDTKSAAASFVYDALVDAGENDQLGRPGAYFAALATIAECETGVSSAFAEEHWGEGAREIADCAISGSEATAKLTAKALSASFPDKDPRELGRIAGKLGKALKYLQLIQFGYRVGTWGADHSLNKAALQLHVFPAIARLGRVWGGNQEGYGKAHPTKVFNGGDPTGVVDHIKWKGWGSEKATGTGEAEYVWPGTAVADNGFSQGAVIVAFHLGNCRGRLAYKAVEWYFPKYGGHFDPDTYIDICSGEYSRAPDRLVDCPDISSADGFGPLTQVTGVGFSCSEASRLIHGLSFVQYLDDGGRWTYAGLRCGTIGWRNASFTIVDCSDGDREFLFAADRD